MRVCPRLPSCPKPPFPPSYVPSGRSHARRRRRERPLRAPWRSSIAQGRVLHAAGDPYTLTFTRSALKPLQAMPFVAGGGVERFGYRAAQVALMCASHSGEPRHVEAVADMLARAGCSRGRPAMRHARAGLLRGARRGAAAAALFDAAAQLLGQAQRRCSPIACNAATTSDDYLDVRPSAAAGDPPRGRALHRRRRGERSSPASTAARRRTTPCRWRRLALAFARLAERRGRRGLRHGAARAGRRDDRRIRKWCRASAAAISR